MGFNSVYKVLRDIFPQVDSRILRAVAIEHFNDADVAVEVVLLEVIPRLSEQSRADKGKSSLNLYEGEQSHTDKGKSSLDLNEDLMDVDGGETGALKPTMESGDVFPSREQNTEAGTSKIGESFPEANKDADLYGQPEIPKVVEPVTSEPLYTSCFYDIPKVVEPETWEPLYPSCFYDANGETDKVCYGIPIPKENLVNNINPNGSTPASASENGVFDNHDHGCVKIEISENGVYENHDHVCVKTGDQNAGTGVSGSIQEAAIDDKFTHLHVDSETTVPLSTQLMGICEKMPAVTTRELDSSSEKDLAATQELDSGSYSKTMSEKDSAVTQELDSGSSSKTMSEKDSAVTQEELDSDSSSKSMSEKDSLAMTIVNPEYEFIMPSISMLTKSDQTCSTELLEDIIEDARNNKKALVSAMDSVVNLMKDVELKEKTAEQAKEVAGRGCSDILAKVDELKQALWRAKEANDMHAGEVYAEKAILATELKELQLRLLNLSDERKESLEILEEMRVALEIRLATALKEIEAAEVEKLEKERSAKEALAYQENQMEMVVEESKRLKMEAEENSKLQEFLMDRGRAIDILQGEIYVKCQDVKLLKEKFDKRIPLSSSQASSLILASSSSSYRSTGTPSESELETYGTPKKSAELADSYGFLEKSSTSKSGLIAESPKSPKEPVNSVNDCFPSGDEKKRDDDRKMLLDDGWELFDNEEDLALF